MRRCGAFCAAASLASLVRSRGTDESELYRSTLGYFSGSEPCRRVAVPPSQAERKAQQEANVARKKAELEKREAEREVRIRSSNGILQGPIK